MPSIGVGLPKTQIVERADQLSRSFVNVPLNWILSLNAPTWRDRPAAGEAGTVRRRD